MPNSTSWFLDCLREHAHHEAIIWNGWPVTYRGLLDMADVWDFHLTKRGIAPGAIVAICGDYSPAACGLLLALIDRGCIAVPLSPPAELNRERIFNTAEVEVVITLQNGAGHDWTMESTSIKANHPLYTQLRGRGNPGLVLFSSGSTGESKAGLHDFATLLEKFKVKRRRMTTLTFLLLDHIGGINTLLYTLSNGGAVVTVQDRNPDAVCREIESNRVELLPTSPTFLNLLLLSRAYERYDLSSLQLITYGTEPMPETTLRRLHEVLPGVELKQTYGLSELGILRSRSQASDSLWVQVGGEDYQTKVQNGTLWVKARSAMLGYLNAPSPFDADGWMDTGDVVEVNGDYLRFLGRRSEIINVGGEKVYPAEVESVLLGLDGVLDATVLGRPNPLTGNVVMARVRLAKPERASAFRKRAREFCRSRLQAYKIPVQFEIVMDDLHSERYKKERWV